MNGGKESDAIEPGPGGTVVVVMLMRGVLRVGVLHGGSR